MSADPGSFRDPHARVHNLDGRIFRVVKRAAQPAYEALQNTDFFQGMQLSGRLVESRKVANPGLEGAVEGDLILEHPRLPLISYPYEWPFAMLQAAALHHLDLQIDALEAGFVLSDASAYNVQFRSNEPVFIDVTSLRPYQQDEPWTAHHQFCESFLAPLVLQARIGVPYQSWYRGNLEGVPVADVARLLRLRDYFSPPLLSHIALPTIVSRKEKGALKSAAAKKAVKGLPRARYAAILQQLRHFIANLIPKGLADSVWGRYSTDNTYLQHETKRKIDLVSSFCRIQEPACLLDIGCNDGVYAACGLQSGARFAVGLDMDQGALHQAFLRADEGGLPFVPLYADLANPSPSQGFAEVERRSLKARLECVDAVLALAVVHHLIIGRNIPMNRAVDWIVGWGDSGLIEFVPKDDPTVQEMLALRHDIFPNYTRAAFVAALEAKAKIVSSSVVSETGREVFHFVAS